MGLRYLPTDLYGPWEAANLAADIAQREMEAEEERRRQEEEQQREFEEFLRQQAEEQERQRQEAIALAQHNAEMDQQLAQMAQQPLQPEPDPYVEMRAASLDEDENRTLIFTGGGYTPTPADLADREEGERFTPQPSWTEPEPFVTSPTSTARGPNSDLVPNQFDRELSRDEAMAACGPAAAVAFARQMGRNPTMREALDIARGIGWTEGGGMNGPANQARLLDAMGIANRLEGAQNGDLNWGNVRAAIDAGNPVTLSTAGHYFVADAFNPDTGQYHVGRSGTAYAAGREWMTPAQMRSLTGAFNGALYMSGEGMAAAAPVSSGPPARDDYARPTSAGLGNANNDLVAYARDRAQTYGVDPDIFVRQISQESNWNPNARSPAGAQGIAQIVPRFHPGVNTSDPYASLDYAARLMGNHLQTYGGDYSRALAAYNAGPGAVQQYGGVPPFRETQLYVSNILGGRTAAPPASVPGPAPTMADVLDQEEGRRFTPPEESLPSMGGRNPSGTWYDDPNWTGPDAADAFSAEMARRDAARAQAAAPSSLDMLGTTVRGGLDRLGVNPLGALGGAIVDTPLLGAPGVTPRNLWEGMQGPGAGPLTGAARAGMAEEQIANETRPQFDALQNAMQTYGPDDPYTLQLADAYNQATRQSRGTDTGFGAAERNPAYVPSEIATGLASGAVAGVIAPGASAGLARNLAATAIDPTNVIGLGIEGVQAAGRIGDALFPTGQRAPAGALGITDVRPSAASQPGVLDRLDEQITMLQHIRDRGTLPPSERAGLDVMIQELETERQGSANLLSETQRALAGRQPGTLEQLGNAIDPALARFAEPALPGAVGGVAGAYEEGERDPRNLLAAAGLGAAGGIGRSALGREINPNLGARLGDMLSAYNVGPPPTSATPRGQAGDAYVGEMLQAGAQRPIRLPSPRNVGEWLERQFADRLSDLNKLGDPVEATLSTYLGRGAAATQRVMDDGAPIRRILGPDLVDDFNRVERVQRDMEVWNVMAQRGGNVAINREFSSGITSPQHGQEILDAIRLRVGEDNWERIMHADAVRRQGITRLRNDMVDEGIIPAQLRDYLEQTQPNYIPTRYLEHIGDPNMLPRGGQGFTQNNPGIRRLTEAGSAGETEAPLDSYLRALAEGELTIQRARAARVIGEALQTNPNTSGLVRRVPDSQAATGIDPNQGLTTVYGHRFGVDRPGEMSYMDNGQRVILNIEHLPAIERAVKRLDANELDWVAQTFRALNSVSKAAFTGLSPSFLPVNAVLDAITTAVVGGRTVLGEPAGFISSLTRDDRWQQMMREGVGSSGFWSRNSDEMLRELRLTGGIEVRTPADLQEAARHFLDELRREWSEGRRGGAIADVAQTFGPDVASGAVGAGLAAATTPEDDPNRAAKIAGMAAGFAGGRRGIQRVNEAVEFAPRTAAYQRAADVGADAAHRGEAGRRVTIDFGRFGQALQVANAFVIFASAGVGGSLQLPRAIRAQWREHPDMLLRATGLAALTALAYVHNQQMPENADIPEWEKERNWYWIIPGASTPNDNGQPGYKSIPRISIPQRDFQLLAQPVRYALDRLTKENPEALDEFARKYLTSVTPVVNLAAGKGEVAGASNLPPAVKAPLELLANRNFYTGSPIEPRSLESVPREERYTERTSAFAMSDAGRAIADRLGISPIQLDHLITSTLGSSGRLALGASNVASGRPSDTPPILGGVASGLFRTTGGGGLQDERYERYEHQYDQRIGAVLDELRALPGYQAMEREDQLSTLRTVDLRLRDQLKGEIGLPTAAERRREPDQPWKYVGVQSVPEELAIDAAFRAYEEYRANRQEAPRPSETQMDLVRRFRRGDSRRYTREYRDWQREEQRKERERRNITRSLVTAQ